MSRVSYPQSSRNQRFTVEFDNALFISVTKDAVALQLEDKSNAASNNERLDSQISHCALSVMDETVSIF